MLGAEYVHVDCMDGHFVPNLTIGAPVVKALRKATNATLDVHLMISNPDQYLDDFIKAGSDIITVHYEANGDTLAQVRQDKEAGVPCLCIHQAGHTGRCSAPAAAGAGYGSHHDRRAGLWRSGLH